MSRVFVAGDWHGNTGWALRTIKEAAHLGAHTLVQLGDFGIWPGEEKYLRKVNAECMRTGVELLVVPGNHDNYNAIARMSVTPDGWLHLPRFPGLRFAPRGLIWQLPNGLWAGALGGAGSIDKNLRTPGKTWWPEEEVTQADVDALLGNFALSGLERLDVLFTHDAPAGVYRPKSRRPVWLTPDVENYCEMQRVLLRQAVDAVRPQAMYHGHWHQWFDDILDGVHVSADGAHHEYRTRVVGLTRDDMADGHMVEVSLENTDTVTTGIISLP